jgi:tricorn protease-like protein
LTADGRILVTADADGLTTYDLAGGEATPKDRLAGVRNARVSSGGTVAASTTGGTIAFYDASTLRETAHPITGVGLVDQFSFSADGRLLLARDDNGRVLVVDKDRSIETWRSVPTVASSRYPTATASFCGSSVRLPG